MGGIFAITKPLGLTSSDVVEHVKERLSDAPIFQAEIKAQIDQAKSNRKKKIKPFLFKRLQKIKTGHGGTLDPLASGVLVIGVGEGTKELSQFLECSKEYVFTAFFGASTTTYDSEGKVLERGPIKHLTNDLVAEALKKFRGTTTQTPPLYSALKMDGKPLYEYARSGEPLPRKIAPRSITIDELEILGDGLIWDHSYRYPQQDATPEEKLTAQSLQEIKEKQGVQQEPLKEVDNMTEAPGKRELAQENEPQAKRLKVDEEAVVESPEDQAADNDKVGPILTCRATVSGGTYIRSLVHDLGVALGTSAYMVKLERTRQGDWKLGQNVIEYQQIMDEEPEVWSPILEKYFELGPKASSKE